MRHKASWRSGTDASLWAHPREWGAGTADYLWGRGRLTFKQQDLTEQFLMIVSRVKNSNTDVAVTDV